MAHVKILGLSAYGMSIAPEPSRPARGHAMLPATEVALDLAPFPVAGADQDAVLLLRLALHPNAAGSERAPPACACPQVALAHVAINGPPHRETRDRRSP